MVEFVMKGGWFMLPIGICLVLAIAISIERFANLRMSRYLDAGLSDRIHSSLIATDFEGALQLCRSRNILFHRLLETAIRYRNLDAQEMRQLLEDQSKQEANALERFLTSLRTIATISPLLGLLGTVAGMIKVFQTLSLEGMSQAGNLSGGISEALITTAAGMCIAIPVIVLHNSFERKVAKILLHMEKKMIEFVLIIRGSHAVPEEE